MGEEIVEKTVKETLLNSLAKFRQGIAEDRELNEAGRDAAGILIRLAESVIRTYAPDSGWQL